MENDELVRFLIERGVISTEERVKELEKRGWVKVTPEGFNDFAKKFAEEMKERFPETAEPDWVETVMGIELPKITRH